MKNSEFEFHQLNTCIENVDFNNVNVFLSVLKVVYFYLCNA
jgi:hypothetical protein